MYRGRCRVVSVPFESPDGRDSPAGQILAQAGDPGAGMFVVLDGAVVVERGDLLLETEPSFARHCCESLLPDWWRRVPGTSWKLSDSRRIPIARQELFGSRA